MGKRWEVLTRTELGWANSWREDDKPMTFASKEDAEEDIAEHIYLCNEAVARGDMDDAPDRDEFMIVEEGKRP
jgi:hypothetical protein